MRFCIYFYVKFTRMANKGAYTYEYPVRNAVSLATDADTIAAISGGLAAATPGMEIPRAWAEWVFGMLKPDLKAILVDFDTRFCAQGERAVRSVNY